jgi:hypothetical protein
MIYCWWLHFVDLTVDNLTVNDFTTDGLTIDNMVTSL